MLAPGCLQCTSCSLLFFHRNEVHWCSSTEQESSLSPNFPQFWLHFHRILVLASCSCTEAKVPFNFHKNQALVLSVWLLLSSHNEVCRCSWAERESSASPCHLPILVILPQKFLPASCSCTEAEVPFFFGKNQVLHCGTLCVIQKLSYCLSWLVVG